jgi:hypothetical protein
MGTRKAFPVDHDTMVDNLLAILGRATDAELAAGAAWYPSATAECRRMADKYDVEFETVCAIVAAYSPRTFWSVNLDYAETLLATGEHPDGSLWMNHNRAVGILRGDDPMLAWSEITAPKIRSFYRNLCGDLSAVTVDVWASLAALGAENDPALVIRRVGGYQAVTEAYRTLAGTLGTDPATVQAQAWVVIRREGLADRMAERMGR